MQVIIPKEIETGNKFAYGHWRDRYNDRNRWIVLLRTLARHIPPATGRRKVTVTAYRKRIIDEDNLSSGFKHGRDAMVKIGLLLDDNRKNCLFVYNECRNLSQLPADLVLKYGRGPLTVLEIEDMSE